MKKIITLCLMTFVLLSCGTSKVVKQSRKTLDGTWTLENINYGDAEGEYEVELFDDTSSECFVGSTWEFISNNNFGNYNISGGADCSSGERYFIWSIPDTDNTSTYDILLKPTDENKKSIRNNAGYRLTLDYLADNSLRITQTLRVNDKPFTINMNFTKASQ